MGCSGDRTLDNAGKKTFEELIARQELKALVDSYANESDRNNQDLLRECFYRRLPCSCVFQ